MTEELACHSMKGEAKDAICCIKKDGFEFFAMLETVHNGEAASEMPSHNRLTAIV